MLLLDENPESLAELNTFVQIHQAQLESSNVPSIFWETLHIKLKDEIFDAGDVFQLIVIEDTERPSEVPKRRLIVSSPEGIDVTDDQHIYLIDHAWIYEANHERQYLEQLPQLLTRMCDLMGYPNNKHEGKEEQDEEEEENIKQSKINFVLREMWKYNNSFSYNVGAVEDRVPLWYIMDEVGCAISHSDDPNFRMVPFIHLPRGICYSLIFPIKNLEYQEIVTRDFVEGLTNDAEIRKALLLPWIPSDYSNVSFEHIEPEESYFLGGRRTETLPNVDNVGIENNLSKKEKIRVFSQYSYVNKYLTDRRFEIIDNVVEADVLWMTDHFQDYKRLNEDGHEVYINQFPCESVLTVKDLLAIVCRRLTNNRSVDLETLETFPSWFPTTYNLVTELVQFVAYFEQRRIKGLDNHWICKPWNLARGLDMHITDNLFHILRLPSSGPKIVQKYVTHPVLYCRPEFGSVKFDVRYVVLLKSVRPLCAYAYSNFFVRFANKPFELRDFDDYEKHFTVMNYSNEAQLYHMKCSQFVTEWNKQYPDFEWNSKVEPTILTTFKELFEAATLKSPPKGIPECRQSRAMYAIDLILEWRRNDINPQILEVNFMPDCQRACEYYPDFFNDIFKCLFLDETNSEIFRNLTDN